MTGGFLEVLNMSYAACFAICIVMLLRLVLQRAPKSFSYMLWSAVWFRLVCPVSFQSVWSLVPGKAPFQAAPAVSQAGGNLQAADGAAPFLTAVPKSAEQSGLSLFAGIWLLGIAALLLYGAVSLLALRRRLIGAVRLEGNVYLADHIPSPFVMGIFHPKIYLPSQLSEEERGYILLHEQTHIRRLDHLIKLGASLTLAVHWFNPLVWAAFLLFVRDMEMSCDERVLRQMGRDIRAEYSFSLLRLAAGRSFFAGAPLAFGEDNPKRRIQNVMKYKKPALWITAAALIVVAATVLGVMANPLSRENVQSIQFPAYQDGKEAYNAAIYDVPPFKVEVSLPEGWVQKLPDDNLRTPTFGFTPVYLFDGEKLEATAAYNTFQLYEDTTDENFYRSVYNQLMLGAHYNWNYEYTPVREDGRFCAATCKVLITDSETGEERYVPGVLAYDKERLVYVAIQFEEGAVTEEELRELAESIKF